jgi:rhomboid protease GluP
VTLLEEAWDLAMAGEWERSAEFYGRLVGNQDAEVHVAALLGLAEARYRLDDDAAALQAWLAATQAPDTSNTWRAWRALAAARVREGDLPGATRSYREALRRAPAEEHPAIASRLGWLSKEMGQRGTSERYFGRARAGGLRTPIATYAILAITVGIGISSLAPASAELWIVNLALVKDAVAAGEWWRLVTVTLVHGGLLHLAFNMYALWIVGPIIESLYGVPRFLGIYLLTAAAGSAASYVFTDAPVAVGASGAVFGLFGTLLVADRVHKPMLTRSARNLTMQIGMLIAINLVLGFSIPGIDNAAHIGGLLAGAWLGFLLVPVGATLASFWQRPVADAGGRLEQKPRARSGDVALRLAGVVALLAVIALAVGVVGPAG